MDFFYLIIVTSAGIIVKSFVLVLEHVSKGILYSARRTVLLGFKMEHIPIWGNCAVILVIYPLFFWCFPIGAIFVF